VAAYRVSSFPGAVPGKVGKWNQDEMNEERKGGYREKEVWKEGEEKKEQVDQGYGLRKWREGQLEGGKIYLRATGVRIVRGRLVSSA